MPSQPSSEDTKNSEILRVLRLEGCHNSAESPSSSLATHQVWLPDDKIGFFRLCQVEESVAEDLIVSFRNEKGTTEKRRVRAAQCEAVSARSLAEDLCQLTEPNAATILHALSQRYSKTLIHTNCGVFCVVVNPWKQLGLYSLEIRSLYRSKLERDLPPHVYAVAQNAVEGILRGENNQSILITGESGSGKTENTKRIIEYIVGAKQTSSASFTPSPSSPFSFSSASTSSISPVDEHILQFTQLLESFGNAKTNHNDNSSRFGKFIRMFMSPEGRLISADIECYLLEKSRVVAQNEGERGFHIFYQLLSPAFSEETRRNLHLIAPSYRFLAKDNRPTIDDAADGAATIESLARLGLSSEERMNVYEVVAACLLIGQIEFSERSGRDMTFVQSRKELGWVAELLGVSSSQMDDALTRPEVEVGGSVVRKNQNLVKTLASAGAVAKMVYSRLFSYMQARCNSAVSGGGPAAAEGTKCIGVLDIAGFEIMNTNSLEQLCINYTNERLQQLFNHVMFVKEVREYEEEGIHFEAVDYALDLAPTIALIDQPLGIFSLLEEECVVPNGNDKHLLEKLLDKHAKHPCFAKAKQSQKSTSVRHFTISHYAGNVDYNVDRWIEKNKDSVERSLLELLSSSSHPLINHFFPKEEVQAARSQAQNKRRPSVRPPSSNTVSFVYRQQLSSLITLLNASHTHFIRCVVPNREARPLSFDPALVLNQLRCNGVLEGIRICRKGFPSRFTFSEFLDRYRILGVRNWSSFDDSNELFVVTALCKQIFSEEASDCYRVGRQRVMFRVGVVSQLEARRRDVIGQLLTGLQAAIRSNLQRQKAAQLKRQRDALLVIQSNIREWTSLRGWAWHRTWLLVRPLISADRTREKIENLEKAVRALELDKKDAEDRNKDLLEEVDELGGELEEAREEQLRAEERVGQLEEEKKRQKRDMDEELKRGEDTLALLERRFAEQHAKVTKMSEHIREYERSHERDLLEKEELQKEIKRLKSAIDREKEARQEMELECKEYIENVEGLETAVEKGNEERKTLKLQLAKAENDLEEAMARANRQSDSISELQRVISEMNEKVGKLDQIVAEEIKCRKRAEKTAEELREAVKERDDRLKKLHAKYEMLKDDMRERERKVRMLEKKLSDKEAIMESCVKELKECHKAKMSEITAEIDDLKRKNSKLETENKTNKSIMETSFERESSIDSDYGASGSLGLRRSSSRLSRQTSYSSMSLSSSTLSSLRLNRRLTEPVPECIPLTRSPSFNAERERRIADLEHQTHTLNTDLQLARREIEVYKTNMNESESEKRSLAKQVKVAAERAAEMEHQIDAEERKSAGLDLRLRKALADIEEWRRRWETINDEHKNEISQIKKRLSDRLEGVEHEKKLVENRHRTSEEAKEQMGRELEKTRNEVERMRGRLDEADRTTDAHAQVGENWQSRCRAAEAELQSLRDDNCSLAAKIRRLYRQLEMFTQTEDTDIVVNRLVNKIEHLDEHSLG